MLVEGVLSNLKESMMQFSKPRKLVNTTNPGGRFMSSSMFSAREVLIPGSAYDRSGAQPQSSLNGGAFFGRDSFMRATHDPMSFIPQDRSAYNAAMHLPVPIGMFMPPVAAFQQPAFPPGSKYLSSTMLSPLSLETVILYYSSILQAPRSRLAEELVTRVDVTTDARTTVQHATVTSRQAR